MGNYTLFQAGGASPQNGGALVSYSGGFIAGLCFAVKGATWFNGYYWWVPSGGDTGAVKCALWSPASSTAGVLVPGSVVTSGTLTANAWNFIPLAAPLQLSASYDPSASANGSAYIAAVGWTAVHGFPDTNGFWGTGGTGAAGLADGPLVAYSGTAGDGGTLPVPYGLAQGVFSTASDPAVTMPQSQSNVDNFWVDVQVSDSAPAGYSGSYRLWPNKGDTNNALAGDSAVNYTIGTEIHLTSFCLLNNIWYYSQSGAANLATRADVWSIASGLSVASITSPSWSGAAGAGWIKAAFPAGTTLPPGAYRVTVFNSNGTAGSWAPKDASTNYFGQGGSGGVGSGGITWGPVNAPSQPDAASGFVYAAGSPGATPPYSSGTAISAQPPFGQNPGGTIQFPQLYAPVGGGANQSQNYWVDLEATPLAYDEPVSAAVSPVWRRQFRHRITEWDRQAVVSGTVAGATAALALAAPAGAVSAASSVTGATAALALAAAGGTVAADGTVAGVAAALALGAAAGSAAAGVSVTGATAALALAAPSGIVGAGAGVTGATAALALAAPAGAVSASSAVAGIPAPLALGAPAGLAAPGTVVSGLQAVLILAVPAGSAEADSSVAGPAAVLALGAPAGALPAGGVLTLTASDGADGTLTAGTQAAGGPS